MAENLYALFERRFPVDRDAPFLTTPTGRPYRYADLEAISGRFARRLADLGVAPGDRVAAQVEKSPEALFLYLACLRLGVAFLPLNTAYTPSEIGYFLGDAEPKVVVCDPAAAATTAAVAGPAQILTLDAQGEGTLTEGARGLDPAFPTAAVAAADLAAIVYTSGTTGRSKGAMLSHGNLAANALTLHRIWGFRPDDVLLHALPIYHVHGLFVASHCVLLNGTGMIFLPRFDPAEILRWLPRATVMMGVPTHYTRLLAEPGLTAAAVRTMRLFISGSAPLLDETHRAFQARTGHAILERYGMTETGMNTSNPLDGERRPGTVGQPLPDVELRIVDRDGRALPAGETGMIEVRGPNVFGGYWRRPEQTAAEFRPDGYFITGDLGTRDADGYIRIVGRGKDLIISGGLNVYPKEVEERIDALDGVDESAVIGVPHPDFGEAVVAVVRPLPGRDLTEAGVLAALHDQLAAFKRPKRVIFVAEIPRNAMGKVQKVALRESWRGLFAAPAGS